MTASCDIIRLRARNIAKPGRSSLFSHVTVGILCPLSFLWLAYASPFHITFAPHERFNRLGPGGTLSHSCKEHPTLQGISLFPCSWA